jgi:hypothetical protein
MRAALNLHTAPSSISANSRTPIRASRNIPGFPFSLATATRKNCSSGLSVRIDGFFFIQLCHFMVSYAANRPFDEDL